MMSSTLADRNGSSHGLNGWLSKSVRLFFEAYNWEGQILTPVAPENLDVADILGLAQPQTLGLSISVSQFFANFPWEGSPVIAAPIAPLEIQAEVADESSLTLDAFSELF